VVKRGRKAVAAAVAELQPKKRRKMSAKARQGDLGRAEQTGGEAEGVKVLDPFCRTGGIIEGFEPPQWEFESLFFCADKIENINYNDVKLIGPFLPECGNICRP
jgi:hypothetical protein